MATYFERFKAYATLIKNSSSDSFTDTLDFAIQRSNFQANDGERHIYQSYRALKPFLNFLGFSAVSCGSLILTKICGFRRQWPLGLHFRFCLVLGSSYSLLHHYLYAPFEIRHLLTTPNSGFSKVCYAVLEGRPDKDLWYTAFNLPPEPQMDVPREYYAVRNFQHSGYSAVIGVNPSLKPTPSMTHSNVIEPMVPYDSIPLDENEFLTDITNATRLYVNSYTNSPLIRDGVYDKYAANQLKNRIATFCDLHDIPMPEYYKPFVEFHESQLTLERPVNYLHVYKEDDKTVRGHLPLAFQSPLDILAVKQARQEAQEEANRIQAEKTQLQKLQLQQLQEQQQTQV